MTSRGRRVPSTATPLARPTRVPRPLPIGWMTLVLAVVLYVAGSNIGSGWVVILSAAMVGALALDLLAVWRTRRGTAVVVQVSAGARTTDPAVVRADVRRPDLGTTLQLADASGSWRGVVRTSTGTLRGVLTLDRGRHEGITGVARTVGALGLAAAVAHHAADGPPTVCRPGAHVAVGQVRALAGTAGPHARTAPRGEEEIRGVRGFTPSDPRRAVHWKATARQGRLMVRETDSAGGADLHLAIAGGDWPQDALDLACEVVASLGEAARAAGHLVHLAADGRTRTWDDQVWQDLAILPPAVGVAPRPLAPPPPGPPALLLRPLPASAAADATMAPSVGVAGIVAGDHALRGPEEVRRWLRAAA